MALSNNPETEQFRQCLHYVNDLHMDGKITEKALNAYINFAINVKEDVFNPEKNYCIYPENLQPTDAETLELFFVEGNYIKVIVEFHDGGWEVAKFPKG